MSVWREMESRTKSRVSVDICIAEGMERGAIAWVIDEEVVAGRQEDNDKWHVVQRPPHSIRHDKLMHVWHKSR